MQKRGRLAPSPLTAWGRDNDQLTDFRDGLRRPGNRDGGGPRIRSVLRPES